MKYGHFPARKTRFRRLTIGLAILLSAGLSLSACVEEPEGSADSTGKSTLAVGQADEVMELDPAAVPSGGRETRAIKRQIFDSLVVQGEDLQPQPQLASSWTQPDELTWVFDLRTDVTFQNGEEFTAETAKFNLDRMMDPKNQTTWQSQLISLIDKVEVKDDSTLIIRTKKPAPTLLTVLAFQEIVPKKYVEKVGVKEFGLKPVGSGPYKFVSRSEDMVVLQRNDDYWGGKPATERIVFRTIPDVSARVAALRSDEIQIADQIPPDLASSLSGDVETATTSGTRLYFLSMNVKVAPFKDVSVRRAVGSAIDTKVIADSLYNGDAQALNQPAFPEMFGYQKDAAGFSHDSSAAKKAFKDVNGQVTIDVKQADVTLAQAVKGQLQDAGLDVKLQALEDEAFDRRSKTGKSEAYISSWGVAEGDLDAILSKHFSSKRGKDYQQSNYKNPKLDTLIEEAKQTTDKGTRMGDYEKAIDLLVSDAPWRPLVTPDDIYGVSSSLQGWEPDPTGLYRLNEAKQGG